MAAESRRLQSTVQDRTGSTGQAACAQAFRRVGRRLQHRSQIRRLLQQWRPEVCARSGKLVVLDQATVPLDLADARVEG